MKERFSPHLFCYLRPEISDLTSTWLPVTFETTFGIAVGGVDGDQDLDIVFGNTGAVRIQNLLYISHQRQAEPRLPATVGQTYTVDFHGDPGLVASLVVGVRAASFSLAPFGVLGLDPAASFVLPVRAPILVIGRATLHSAQGKATIRMPIPKAPSLVDSQLLTKGVLLDPQSISSELLT